MSAQSTRVSDEVHNTGVKIEKVVSAEEQSKSHHKPNGAGFLNPWPSAGKPNTFWSFFGLFSDWDSKSSKVPPVEERHPLRPVDIDRVHAYSSAQNDQDKPGKGMLLTWLGHAAFHLALKCGINILFDPCCSRRCSPVQFMGPARITEVPCKVEDLKTDIIIISHNHYDHLDLNTLTNLNKSIVCFVPLGCGDLFRGLKFTHVYELDWWDSFNYITEKYPEHPLEITCTPCQHFSGRGLLDRDRALWASWSLKTPAKQTFFFGGDTGYRAVPKNYSDDLDKLSHCPAFKEIGNKFGGFDLACIPIGAYSPRWFMSKIHCAPEDSVCLHQDIKSRLSVGMHFGTFVLTDEPIKEPPIRLREACRAKNIPDEEFRILDMGESLEV